MKHIIPLLALAFFSIAIGCNTEGSSTGPTSTISNSDLPMAQSQKVDPAITITFSNSPWTVNQAGTVNVSLGNGQDITGTTAKFQLYKATNKNTGAPCCGDDPNVKWTLVAQGTQGSNTLSFNFTPSATGNYGWKVHFVKGNSSYTNGFETSVCLTVGSAGNGDGSTWI